MQSKFLLKQNKKAFSSKTKNKIKPKNSYIINNKPRKKNKKNKIQ